MLDLIHSDRCVLVFHCFNLEFPLRNVAYLCYLCCLRFGEHFFLTWVVCFLSFRKSLCILETSPFCHTFYKYKTYIQAGGDLSLNSLISGIRETSVFDFKRVVLCSLALLGCQEFRWAGESIEVLDGWTANTESTSQIEASALITVLLYVRGWAQRRCQLCCLALSEIWLSTEHQGWTWHWGSCEEKAPVLLRPEVGRKTVGGRAKRVRVGLCSWKPWLRIWKDSPNSRI